MYKRQGLEADLNNAQQASKDLKQNTAASVTKIETAGQTQIDLIKQNGGGVENALSNYCLLYTSDAADEEDSVDLCGRRINKKKKIKTGYETHNKLLMR